MKNASYRMFVTLAFGLGDNLRAIWDILYFYSLGAKYTIKIMSKDMNREEKNCTLLSHIYITDIYSLIQITCRRLFKVDCA